MRKLMTTILVAFFMSAVLSIKPYPPKKARCTDLCLMEAKENAAGREVKRMREIMDSKDYDPMNAAVLEPEK